MEGRREGGDDWSVPTYLYLTTDCETPLWILSTCTFRVHQQRKLFTLFSALILSQLLAGVVVRGQLRGW